MSGLRTEGIVTEDRAIGAVLRHPLRLKIVVGIGSSEASPKELADRLGEPLGNVSYHVRELLYAGVLQKAGTRQVRGAVQHFYRCDTEAVVAGLRAVARRVEANV